MHSRLRREAWTTKRQRSVRPVRTPSSSTGPASAGGGGLGLNGGELLYLAVAGCVSNDLFREAQATGIALRRVRVRARGDFTGDPAVSTEITYEVDVEGDASAERLRALVEDVDRIAEIPNSMGGTRVRLTGTK